MASLGNKLRRQLQDHHFILLGLSGCLILFAFPLQHYMSLGRFQHYGLCLFVLGLSYIIQAVWSWTRLSLRGRLGFLIPGLYLASMGMVLYANTWLDPGTGLLTQEQKKLSKLIVFIYAALGLPLSGIYIGWAQEEGKHLEDKETRH